MKGCLRIVTYFLLFAVSIGAALYLHEKWQRRGKEVVVIMRSSNEDCDEFHRIWKIDRVLWGSLDAEERAYYADCSGTLIFRDKTVSRIASGTQASTKGIRR